MTIQTPGQYLPELKVVNLVKPYSPQLKAGSQFAIQKVPNSVDINARVRSNKCVIETIAAPGGRLA